jgi:hypothetical protein
MGYGRIEAIYVITQMLVGDGDNTRQQRLNIFNANFTLIGLYSGEHSVNGH